MRKENRIIAIPIDWKLLKDFIVDRIDGLPDDVELIGVKHDYFSMCDVMGLYSKKFKRIQEGITPDYTRIDYDMEEHKGKRKIVRVWVTL